MKSKDLQILFLVLGIAFAIFAGILSFQKDTDSVWGEHGGGGASIDIAADGGAAGFAMSAGLCFICVTIIQIKKKEEKKIESISKIVYSNQLADDAIKDYIANDIESSIKKLRESISLLPTNAINHYNIACAYAKINDLKKVLYHLECAVENGYENFEKINKEPVFEELRKIESFIEFVCNGYKVKAK